MDFSTAYKEKVDYINKGLISLLKSRKSYPTVQRAMEYSLMAGGKRLRPVLLLSAYELAYLDDNTQENEVPISELASILPMACAMEMIHSYSLIHDDLPAMDNDDYRRGKLTNHKVFGESTAILAGDGLLNLAYEVMLENVPENPLRLNNYVKAMTIIANSAGISGMIGGQSADMDNQGENNDEEVLNYIHTHKTEALITASLRAGALAYHDKPEVLHAVTGYGKALGLAFQITDDILDLTGDFSQLGKATGQDEKMGKQTYPARYGLEKSMTLTFCSKGSRASRTRT
jgi:geranylgeranyl diphosphate synthase type II